MTCSLLAATLPISRTGSTSAGSARTCWGASRRRPEPLGPYHLGAVRGPMPRTCAHPRIMLLDAESLNHVTGASVLGWRAGGTLLGLIAGRDSRRRVMLVASNGDSFLIADLEAYPGARPGERPRVPRGHLLSC